MPLFPLHKDKIKQGILIIFLIFWIYNWLGNFYRDFANHFEKTKKLCGKSLQEKWEYIFGADLYKFLSVSKKIIPVYEKISLLHNLESPKGTWAYYFLYPRLSSEDSNFILVYKCPYQKSEQDKIIYTQDSDIFIIKK